MVPLFANVVWPALLLSMRMSALPCILASFLIEAAALWRYAGFPLRRAVLASFAANLVSSFIGFAVLPLFGLRMEAFADDTYKEWFGWGTFNPVTYLLTWMVASVLNTIVEGFIIWLVFRMDLKGRWLRVLLAANAVTAFLAALSLMVYSGM